MPKKIKIKKEKKRGKKKGFFSIEREDALKGGKFVLRILLFYLILLALSYFLVPLGLLEETIASHTNYFLGLAGIKGEVIKAVNESPAGIEFQKFNVEINYLCTGLLELTVLLAAIIATPYISSRKKIFGVMGAIIVSYIFNLARIVFTITAISSYSIKTAELTHDVLFRISLFIIVAGYYFVWLKIVSH
ncbi:MAG: exosortase/archaeosortase family protein [Candidatus Diapherotrites archaeon]